MEIKEHEEEKNNKFFECRKCKKIKLLSDFIKDRTRKRGHHPYCRHCQNKIKNNERALKRSLKWQKENKEKRAEICSRWNINNPENSRVSRHKRRKLVKNNNDNTINKDSLLKLSKEICGICNTELDWSIKGSIRLDHILPLSKGGKHSILNVQWTHSYCNLSKNNNLI